MNTKIKSGTKKEKILALLSNGGLTYAQIAKKVGTTRGYVDNLARNLKSPELYRKIKREYQRNQRKSGSLKKYRAIYPQKRAAQRTRTTSRRQSETRPSALKHGQPWTIKELEHLEYHGKSKTIVALALELGRTYKAVQAAAQKHNISLIGIEKNSGHPRLQQTARDHFLALLMQ